jgi:NAD-dependent dihydropyrimidine dehydrogenase PreA subunit
MAVVIDYDKCCWKDGACSSCSCTGKCRGCVEVCPTKALQREDIVEIYEHKCVDCGACIRVCPQRAITAA